MVSSNPVQLALVLLVAETKYIEYRCSISVRSSDAETIFEVSLPETADSSDQVSNEFTSLGIPELETAITTADDLRFIMLKARNRSHMSSEAMSERTRFCVPDSETRVRCC